MARSPLYQLVEDRLGVALDEFVGERRQPRVSWSALAADLRFRTGVELSPETLRLWFTDDLTEVAS